MRIALIGLNPSKNLYPIGLLKIGAMLKDKGHKCQLMYKIPKPNEYDQIWLSTVFTFNIPKYISYVREAKKRGYNDIMVGGVAATLLSEIFEKENVEVHKGLLPEAENYHPDYSLLEKTPDYSITHTSRGCVRKCPFCMVPIVEPKYEKRINWKDDIHRDSKKILFYDNNFLADKTEGIKEEIEKIKDVLRNTNNNSVDFNQALDCRLLTEKKADLLAQIPMRPVRFAFDGMQEDGYYQKAVKMMAERGYKTFVSYVLYNFEDTPQDFYYRLRESARLSDELNINVTSFPMRYQPILDYDKGRHYTGEHWTSKQKKGFMNILNKQSIGGQISQSLEMFEYWFTNNADRFAKLISWDKVNEYAARKKGALRFQKLQMGKICQEKVIKR